LLPQQYLQVTFGYSTPKIMVAIVRRDQPTDPLVRESVKYPARQAKPLKTKIEKERCFMSAKNPKDVFLTLLSDARNNTERSASLYREISELAQNPDVQEALEARAFVAEKNLEVLDQCFEIIEEKPVKLKGRLHDVFVEDFKKELGEIQSPAARHLYILAKATHLAHLRFAEYAMLIAASDVTGHYGVGLLLESVLADKLAFLERTQRLVRHIIEGKIAQRLAA
jgi:ferritin-like metal-binding protein YciE